MKLIHPILTGITCFVLGLCISSINTSISNQSKINKKVIEILTVYSEGLDAVIKSQASLGNQLSTSIDAQDEFNESVMDFIRKQDYTYPIWIETFPDVNAVVDINDVTYLEVK